MSSTNWVQGATVRILGLNTDKMIEFSFDNGTSFYDNSTLRFITNTTERMRIASNGNIGIGTNNPTTAKVVINGTAGQTGLDMSTFDLYTEMRVIRNSLSAIDKNMYFQFLTGAGSKITLYSNNGTSLICQDGTVVFPNGLTNNSDSRIKKDIEDINDDTALTKLLLIQPKTYNYIDIERNKGFGKVYGFIAQQIREVIPEAVSIIQYVIPNIYKDCIIENNNRIYITLPEDVIGRLIRMGDGSTYKIILVESDYIELEKHMGCKDIPDGEIFVYGTEVDDFHTLNKDYIFTLNVCATQELNRRIEAQSLLIQSQDDRIKELEIKMERLLSGTT